MAVFSSIHLRFQTFKLFSIIEILLLYHIVISLPRASIDSVYVI